MNSGGSITFLTAVYRRALWLERTAEVMFTRIDAQSAKMEAGVE